MPAQDKEVLREFAEKVVAMRVEEVAYVRAVINFIVNYITGNPANQVTLQFF